MGGGASAHGLRGDHGLRGHASSQIAIGEQSHSPPQRQASGGLASLASGSLMSRRAGGFRRPLQVKTRKEAPRTHLSILGRIRGHGAAVAPHHAGIKKVDAVSVHYALGAEVMPSTHNFMEIKHAMRLEDGERVVIKIRHKPGSFLSPTEEREWVDSMEFMLNLPKSGHIAQLYEILEDGEGYYVVMEKVEGMDLFETLDCHGYLPIGDCKGIIRQLLEAVADLHDSGCIHKDLKLENVMVDKTPKTPHNPCVWGDQPAGPALAPGAHATTHKPLAEAAAASPHLPVVCFEGLPPHHVPGEGGDGDPGDEGQVVKIIDFDTVEEWAPDGERKCRSIVGTDQYISPEAYAGHYTPASDVFAMGVIAYRLLTGSFPFNGDMFDDEAGENWVGSPKMKQIQQRVQRAAVDFTMEPFPREPMAAELVRAMLSPDEAQRPSAREALNNPWLNRARSKTPGPAFHSSCSSGVGL